MNKFGSETIAVRGGIDTDTQHGAVVPPIYLSSNYTFKGYDEPREYDYARRGNPTRSQLAKALADLEGGAYGVMTCTGLAAITTVIQLLSPEDTLVIPHDCYGGSYRMFDHLERRGLFKLVVVDQNDQAALDAAIALKPKMVWIETPSNPLLRLVDVKAIAAQAKAVGAYVVVDNTFLTPILQQPLSLGADIVLHSCTKYINGHSDVVAGAIITKDHQLGVDLDWWANCIGVTGSAFDSYMAMRGLRTLPVRLKQHQESAATIAAFLNEHPAVAKVYYPGLEDHPQHELAKSQQLGFGAMLSFDLAGDIEQSKLFVEEIGLFCLAESLGGVESLVAHPATMTHAGMEESARITAGISNSLIRLSVGLESVDDLIQDLSQSLDTVLASL
ncbi:cystathionine gamma-synthase [Psychrobium sp. 1_MG-2023]|uniref:cystathionine gamma-synthase n=1 Tax=Psychrobium sp. 1_MG-2023 TaxID=3062624 RepID=UPI000C33B86F|nr:cystathionine gamma-synthase [Psychrobium sp. 1_MG-2023]MDP2562552.1 cystathionine gamma-synthase [Psychrobium sp. 1_MG-2023]PKF54428.1 O-succinylhomoserine (thiol)-lyase [Alteromonadales bacterium alter-6D02]